MTPQARPTLHWRGALLLGWIAVAMGLTVWLAWRARYVARLKRCAVQAPQWLQELLETGRRSLGLERPVSLKISTEIRCPAACGLFRPVILFPASVANHLSSAQLRAVLLHELAHFKRGDLWVNYAQTLLQIFYCWQPLLWLANTRLRRLREQAVDETVQVALGREAEAYAEALVAVARLALAGPPLSLAMVGIIEGRAALKERIQRLAKSPVPSTARLGVAARLALMLAGLVLLPMARGQKNLTLEKQSDPARIAQPEGTIGLQTRTFKVDPAVFVKNLEIRRQETLRPPSDHYLEVLGGLLREAGVDASPPRGFSFNQQTGDLVTQNTPEALDAAAKVVAALNDPDLERSIRGPSTSAEPVPWAALQTRTFKVNAAVFAQVFGRNRQPLSPLSDQSIKTFYKTLLDFGAEPVPSEVPLATFNEPACEIVVHNSARGLRAAARLIDYMSRPDQDTVHLDFKLMKMTDAAWASLPLDAAYPSELPSSRFWLLAPDQLLDFTHRLDQQPGIEPISRPRIQTSHGVNCSLYTGQAQPPDNISLDCLAYTRTEGDHHLIDLTVVAHTTGKFTSDPSGDWPKAQGWTNVALFARPTLMNGAGVVLHRQHPGPGATNNLVMLISVTASKAGEH